MSESELPNLSATADCIARVKRTLKLSILISEKNPLSLQFYENLTTIRKLRRRQIASGINIIHCFSEFSIYYEMWMGIIFTICLVHFPLQVAFADETTQSMLFFSLCVDGACLVDIILRFRTAFVVWKEKRIVTDPRTIAMHYLQTYFVPDVISTIPNPYVFVPTLRNVFLNMVSVLCLFKLCRLKTAQAYITKTARYFRVDRRVFRLILSIFFFVLFCHWTTCIVYLMPRIRVSFIARDNNVSTTQERLDQNSLLKRYIHSLYNACAYILAVKQSPLEKLLIEEKILACVLYIIGKIIIFSFTVLAVGKFLSAWKLESKYYEVVEELEGFISRKQLAAATRTRLLQYYNYKFRRTYFEEHTIKSILSERLRDQINQNILQKFIANVDLFENIPQETLNRIISHLHLEIFLPHDLIIKAGTVGEFMYFLCSGTVSVYTPSGKEICHLQDGAYFGEISLLKKDQRRTAHVFAVEICELYTLDKRSFNNYVRPVKTLISRMTSVANMRLEMTKVYNDIHMRNFTFS